MPVVQEQLKELVLQGLETELGGVKVYTAALTCVKHPELKQEWERYLAQTERHVQVMRDLITELGLNPDEDSPGREVCKHIGQSLVAAMTIARESGGPPEAAQLVAAECVVNAETKDHLNWSLLEKLIPELDAKQAAAIKAACNAVEDEEDEHLYHTKGWGRELWLQSLGMPALLPPPEEVRHETTAAGAAHAEAKRDVMLEAQRKH